MGWLAGLADEGLKLAQWLSGSGGQLGGLAVVPTLRSSYKSQLEPRRRPVSPFSILELELGLKLGYSVNWTPPAEPWIIKPKCKKGLNGCCVRVPEYLGT